MMRSTTAKIILTTDCISKNLVGFDSVLQLSDYLSTKCPKCFDDEQPALDERSEYRVSVHALLGIYFSRNAARISPK